MAEHTKPRSHEAAQVRGWRGVLNAKIPALCEPGRAVLIGLKVFGSPEMTYRGRFGHIDSMEKPRFLSAARVGGYGLRMFLKKDGLFAMAVADAVPG